MKNIKIIIEKTKDMYTAYAENAEGIYGGGNTIDEAKASILTSIKLYDKYNKKEKQEYSITYKLDAESFLKYYKGIFTNAALERLTGINQKQFPHYAKGLKKPRTLHANKIQSALHKLGQELISIEL